MKKMLLAVMLLGLGFMVGCGDDKPTTKPSGSAAGSGTGAAHHDTTAPADTSKK